MEIEDIDHILRRCPRATQVWISLKHKNLNFMQGELDFAEWFFHDARVQHEDHDCATKYLLTLWYLWKRRCAACFDPSHRAPVDKA